jgi:hypothetical protein
MRKPVMRFVETYGVEPKNHTALLSRTALLVGYCLSRTFSRSETNLQVIPSSDRVVRNNI